MMMAFDILFIPEEYINVIDNKRMLIKVKIFDDVIVFCYVDGERRLYANLFCIKYIFWK